MESGCHTDESSSARIRVKHEESELWLLLLWGHHSHPNPLKLQDVKKNARSSQTVDIQFTLKDSLISDSAAYIVHKFHHFLETNQQLRAEASVYTLPTMTNLLNKADC